MQIIKVKSLILYLRKLQRLTIIVRIQLGRKAVVVKVNTISMKGCIMEITTNKTTTTYTIHFNLNSPVIRLTIQVRKKKVTVIRVRKKAMPTFKSNLKSNSNSEIQARGPSYHPNTFI